MKIIEPSNANARPLHHRRMSNNSVAFTNKPSREMLNLIFTIMQGEGEPGFVNLEAANQRRPDAEGLNPCAEILLDSYGVCNLTTINVDAFVKPIEKGGYELDIPGLLQAQALSARAGIRMTCVDLELPHWDKVQKRDRLIGTSVTGWQDAMGKLGFDENMQNKLLNLMQDVIRQECVKYAHVLRIPTPLLDTTVKPEGTLSQVAGGVSSGLHVSHAPYYIRRIRINAHDPLANVAKVLNWPIHPEVGQDSSNPRTLVIEFPVKSGATKTKKDVTVKEQFDVYFQFQSYYTAHNSSNTISVKPDEWSIAEDIVWDNWEDFVGVSFLADDGGSYQLAPYEEISEDEYNTRKAQMKPFDANLLLNFEGEIELDGESCTTGACPTR
jgi:adenosylcobalamin-dependent ribonucleoside-triphosphate reductase